MRTPYSQRQERLRKALRAAKADAFLTLHGPNVLYLCGFSGSSAALLVEPRGARLWTDSRYTFQAAEEVASAGVRIVKGSLLAAVGERLRKLSALHVGFEASRLTVQQLQLLRKAAGSKVRWQKVHSLLEAQRAVKEPGEIALMQKSAALGSQVFEDVLPLIRPGVREFELAAEIEYRMRRLGASGPAFETIVAFGERSALPHARPTQRRLRKNELVVLDLGAILRHYCCDLTRTVYFGRAPARIRGWYQAVLEAQTAARSALRPGVTAGQVDEAARSVLQKHRLGRFFTHSTGHGLGLEVHEDPSLAAGQQQKLQSFNVVTLEPGVYVQGVGGIRIEDDAVVTPGEARILTTARRELLEL
ncbi:MAG: aminopeptidase P family protein [Acidobacteria bacterium]|nr:aminopeptidase P family protein [Acidobacteriota bacterium]MBI3662862.1 aminopeptidase P family protein [Acidobacteriota bacterium]